MTSSTVVVVIRFSTVSVVLSLTSCGVMKFSPVSVVLSPTSKLSILSHIPPSWKVGDALVGGIEGVGGIVMGRIEGGMGGMGGMGGVGDGIEVGSMGIGVVSRVGVVGRVEISNVGRSGVGCIGVGDAVSADLKKN
jgi:hypothetical protein